MSWLDYKPRHPLRYSNLYRVLPHDELFKCFTLDASVPGETEAIIYLPYSDGQTVKLNDSVIYENGSFAETDNIKFVGAEDGFIVFSVSAAQSTQLHFEAVNQ